VWAPTKPVAPVTATFTVVPLDGRAYGIMHADEVRVVRERLRVARERVASFRVPAAVTASRPFRAVAPRVLPSLHRAIHRLSGGRTLLTTSGQPMAILETTGARTGARRETPLGVVPRDDGTFVVVGSNFARETHPAWTANLIAHPEAAMTFRRRRVEVTARLLSDAERDEVWPELLRWFPGWERYTEVTDRTFRVFELTPR